MFIGKCVVVCLLFHVFLCCAVETLQNGTSFASSGQRILSRKRRFLLFPPGANFIVTVSGGKGSLFATPRGFNVVTELDMYHPLPDYMYHASSLRLGTVAMYPSETTTTTTTTVTPSKPPAIPISAHEPSEQDVKEYLLEHPETWVPPRWSQDRIDWEPVRYSSLKTPDATNPATYRWWKNKLWETTGNDRLYYHNPSIRRMRSLLEGDPEREDDELSHWTRDNHLNISHHRGWEHFHHYRDRRSLYEHLETTIPSIFGFHMKECLLRSICEARALLPPKGRSMTVDILRVIFTYPLKDELSDDYSRMMRETNANCRDLFFEKCPLSIFQLLLFGKFEL